MRKSKKRSKLGRGNYGVNLMAHFDARNNDVERRREVHQQYVARMEARKAARASAK